MKFSAYLSALTLGAVLAVPSPVLAETDQPTVAVTSITPSLKLLKGRGGNVLASVGPDGVLLVDTDYSEYAEAYHQAINQLTTDEQSARFVLNTHWHGDHTGGNLYWGERQSVIMAHDNVRQRMSTRQHIKHLDRVTEPSPALALPLVTYGDAIALHFNGDDVEVQHYPSSHTDGDSIVYFAAANVVHMGDVFWLDRFPFVDQSSGGNVMGVIATVEAVLARVDDDSVIIPGHGSLSGRADLERYHRMLVSTSSTVKEGLAAGRALEEIPLGEEWKAWGEGFITEQAWVSFIAGSL